MKRFIRRAILSAISLIILVCTIIFAAGYSLYKEVVIDKGKIETRVNEIRANEDYVELKDISIDFLDSIVAIEDMRFYKHGAIEVRSLLRATLINFKEKQLLQGGSTITQQVAKNIYFDNDTSLEQKVAEMIIGYILEKKYSKDDILELYVNIIYYGDNNYGIKEASANYFNKMPIFLDYEESTLLAGLPQAPSAYALSTGRDLALERQEQVKSALIEYRQKNK